MEIFTTIVRLCVKEKVRRDRYVSFVVFFLPLLSSGFSVLTFQWLKIYREKRSRRPEILNPVSTKKEHSSRREVKLVTEYFRVKILQNCRVVYIYLRCKCVHTPHDVAEKIRFFATHVPPPGYVRRESSNAPYGRHNPIFKPR